MQGTDATRGRTWRSPRCWCEEFDPFRCEPERAWWVVCVGSQQRLSVSVRYTGAGVKEF